MRIKHLEILRDPITLEELELKDAIFEDDEVISGKLTSKSHVYPIRNGIPRFVIDDGYSENFGWQWNKWARVQFEDENVGRPMENHTRSMFIKITEFSHEKLKNKVVLDMGCGPGRFTDIALEMGATVVALDYSSAIDAAKDNFKRKNADVLFIQGDALHLPIKSQSIDYSFSIGVLHHTPSPSTGVREAHRVTKTNGEFALSVYSSGGYYTFLSVIIWRRIFKTLWPIFKHYPPLIYSQIFGRLGYLLGKTWRPLTYPLRIVFPTVYLPDLRWAILDTFDSVTPSYQSGHTFFEVYCWFRDNGFSNIRPSDWAVNFIGTK